MQTQTRCVDDAPQTPSAMNVAAAAGVGPPQPPPSYATAATKREGAAAWAHEARVRPIREALVSSFDVPPGDATVLALVASLARSVREGDAAPDGPDTLDAIYSGASSARRGREGRRRPRASHFGTDEPLASDADAAPTAAAAAAAAKATQHKPSRDRSRSRDRDAKGVAALSGPGGGMVGPVVSHHDNHYVVKVESRARGAVSADWLRRLMHVNELVPSEPVVGAEAAHANGRVFLCARVLACAACADLPAWAPDPLGLGRVQTLPSLPSSPSYGAASVPRHLAASAEARLREDPLRPVAPEDISVVAAVAAAAQCIVAGGHDEEECAGCAADVLVAAAATAAAAAAAAGGQESAPWPPTASPAVADRVAEAVRRGLSVEVALEAVPGVSSVRVVVPPGPCWYEVRVETPLPFVVAWDDVAALLRAAEAAGGRWGELLWVRVEAVGGGGEGRTKGGALSVGVAVRARAPGGHMPLARCRGDAGEAPHGAESCLACPACVAAVPASRQVGLVDEDDAPRPQRPPRSDAAAAAVRATAAALEGRQLGGYM